MIEQAIMHETLMPGSPTPRRTRTRLLQRLRRFVPTLLPGATWACPKPLAMKFYKIFEIAIITALGATQAVSASVALGQPVHQFVVVPVTRGNERLDEVLHLAEEVQDQLAHRGMPAFPLGQTSQAFSALHSREPVPASQQDFDLVVSEANAANVALALDRPREALEHLQNVRTRMVRALETLNRQTAAAEHYVQACMRTINILALEQGRHDLALQIAIECISNSPDTDFARGRMHPKVRDVFTDASAKIQSDGAAPLVVESEPPGCNVVLNGRRLGSTKFKLDHPVRRTYLVQVDCGSIGRVYTVKTDDNERRVFVDVFFDNALRTADPVLRLSYSAPDAMLARSQAMQVAQVLGTREALVISASSPSRMLIRRVHPTDGGVVFLDFPYGPDALRSALDKLLARHSAGGARKLADGTSTAGVGQTTAFASTKPAGGHAGRWRWRVGAPLAATGIASMGIGYWLFTARTRDGEDFRTTLPLQPGYLQRGSNWFDQRPSAYLAVGLGAVVASAGTALLALELEPTERIWLPTASAGLALGAIAWGGFDLSQGGACLRSEIDPRACVLAQQRTDRGSMFLLSALPLLTFPAVQLARRWLHQHGGGDVQIGPAISLHQRGLQAIVSF